jgi:hypothetical protein
VTARVQFAIDIIDAPNKEDAEKVMTEFLTHFDRRDEGYRFEEMIRHAAVQAASVGESDIFIDDARLWLLGEPESVTTMYTTETESSR